MSGWLGSGFQQLTNLRGQLTELTKEVLSESADGNPYPESSETNASQVSKDVVELENAVESLNIEVDRLSSENVILCERAEAAELQLDSLANRYKKLSDQKQNEIVTLEDQLNGLKEQLVDQQSKVDHHSTRDEERFIVVDADSHDFINGSSSSSSGGSNASGVGVGAAGAGGGAAPNSPPLMSPDFEVRSLKDQVDHLKAEVGHWRNVVNHHQETQLKDTIVDDSVTVELEDRIKVMQEQLDNMAVEHQHELESLQNTIKLDEEQRRKVDADGWIVDDWGQSTPVQSDITTQRLPSVDVGVGTDDQLNQNTGYYSSASSTCGEGLITRLEQVRAMLHQELDSKSIVPDHLRSTEEENAELLRVLNAFKSDVSAFSDDLDISIDVTDESNDKSDLTPTKDDVITTTPTALPRFDMELVSDHQEVDEDCEIDESESVKSENKALKNENDNLKIRLAQIEEQSKELSIAYSELNEQFEQSSAESRTVVKSNRELSQKLEALKGDLTEYEEKYEKCRLENTKAMKHLDMLTSEFERLRSELVSAKTSNDLGNRNLETEMNRMSEQLTDSMHKRESLIHRLEDFQEVSVKLDAEITRVRKENVELRQENIQVNEVLAEHLKKFKNVFCETEQEIDLLRVSLKTYQVESLNKEKELRHELQDERELVQSLRERIKVLKNSQNDQTCVDNEHDQNKSEMMIETVDNNSEAMLTSKITVLQDCLDKQRDEYFNLGCQFNAEVILCRDWRQKYEQLMASRQRFDSEELENVPNCDGDCNSALEWKEAVSKLNDKNIELDRQLDSLNSTVIPERDSYSALLRQQSSDINEERECFRNLIDLYRRSVGSERARAIENLPLHPNFNLPALQFSDSDENIGKIMSKSNADHSMCDSSVQCSIDDLVEPSHIEALETKLNHSSARCAEFESELNDLNEQIRIQDLKVEQLESELKQSVDLLSLERSELESTIDQQTLQMKEQDVLIDRLRKDLNEHKQSEDNIRHSLESDNSVEKERLKKTISTLEVDNEALRLQVDTLTDQLAQVNKQLTLETTTVSELLENVENEKEQLSIINTKMTALELEKNNLFTLAAEKHKETLKYYEEMQRLNTLVLHYTNVVKIDASVQTIQPPFDEGQIKLRDERINILTQQLNSTHMDLDASQTDFETLEASLKNHKDRIEILQKENDNFGSKILELQNSTAGNDIIDELNNKIKQLNDNNQHLQRQLLDEGKRFDQAMETVTNSTTEKTQNEREIERLRLHLVEVEENYTNEALKAELVENELRNKLNILENQLDSTSSTAQVTSVHLKDQLDDLKSKLKSISSERDNALHELANVQEREEKSSKSLSDLQSVMQNFQQECDSHALQQVDKYKHDLINKTSQIGVLESKIVKLQNCIDESNSTIESFGLLAEEMDTKERLILEHHQQELQYENDVAQLKGKIFDLQVKKDGQIDKEVIKNILLGYFTAPEGNKAEVASLIGHILDFSDDQMKKITGGSEGWLKYLSSSSTASTSTSSQETIKNSIAEQFVKFLEHESNPKKELPTEIPSSSDVVRNIVGSRSSTPGLGSYYGGYHSNNNNNIKPSPTTAHSFQLPTFDNSAALQSSADFMRDVFDNSISDNNI